MFKNFPIAIGIKSAWRNLIRNKIYSLINILGLATGMTVAMLIAFWIRDEVTYNDYHTNHAQLAQVMTTYIDNDGKMETDNAVCMPIGKELRSKYGSDFTNVAMASWNFSHIIAVGEKKITGNGMWVESNFPSMFSLRMEKGKINALTDPSSVLLSASMAKTLFGNADAMNKMVKLDNKDSYKVAGVFKDLPHNTTLYEAKYFLPWKKYITTQPWLKDAAT